MPYCTLCGGMDFDCTDGFYYCTVCNTQSQDVYVETVNFSSGYQTRNAVVSVTQEQLKKKTVKKQLDLGRPWKTHEAYQVILKEMSKAVISLGARKELMDIVFRLWMLYLGKCGIAFVKCDAGGANVSSASQQFFKRKTRQLFPGTLEDPRVKQVRLAATRKLKHPEQTRKQRILQAAMKNETFYEGDNPLAGLAEDIDLSKMVGWELKRRQEEAETKNNNLMHEGLLCSTGVPMYGKVPVSRLTMDKLLCLINIGLMYTNSMMLPSDLVRWVTDGLVPYTQAMSLLPEKMCFFGQDYKDFFVPKLPNVSSILATSKQLLDFLELKNRPIVDVVLLTSRYIVELNLPGELHHLVTSLIRQQPPDARYNCDTKVSLPDFAALSMAYIVITLKLLFGLDGRTEAKLSDYARQSSVHVSYEQPLFIWEEWVSWSEQQMAQNVGCHFPQNIKDLKHLQDVEKVMNHFDSVLEHPHRPTQGVPKFGKHHYEQAEKMHSEMKDLASDVRWSHTNYRSFYSSTLMDFSMTTLKYITASAYVKCIDDAASDADEDLFNDSDEDMFNDSDEQSSLPQRKRRKLSGGSVAVTEQVNARPVKGLHSVSSKTFPSPGFPYYASIDTSGMKSFSYQWVLSRVASHINSTPDNVDDHVSRLELIHIVPEKLLSRSENQTLTYFIRRYFTTRCDADVNGVQSSRTPIARHRLL